MGLLGTWPDETHLAPQHVHQLGKLVEGHPPYERRHRGPPRGHDGVALRQRAELEQAVDPPVVADSLLAKEHRPPERGEDGEAGHQDHRRDHH